MACKYGLAHPCSLSHRANLLSCHRRVVRNQSDREAPWGRFHEIVDRLMGEIEVPEFGKTHEKK